jgi:5-methylcytosine-specific restriction protein A
MDNDLIFTKQVDKSVLCDGFTIPVYLHEAIYESLGHKLEHGERSNIKVMVGSHEYEVSLINQAFNQKKFEGHTDVLQVRYTKGSDFSQAMREIFCSTYDYIIEQKKNLAPKKQVKIPDDIREQLMLYKIDGDNCYRMECLTVSDHIADIKEVVTEESFELPAEKWIDPKASIATVNKLVKIRRIDQSISYNLKRLYNYCDQITGLPVGEVYGHSIVEAHHIDFFVNSQNNDASNIIILSPNFHRIVHQNKPEFDRAKKVFIFQNGVIEPVRLNKHL